MNFSSMAPTTELDAVNAILSGIGEAPVNSFAEITTDVTVARSVLYEISKEVQLEGFHWNTEDQYPLTPNDKGEIMISPALVRVHFKEPTDRELIIRGNRVYDRVNHSYVFAAGTILLCTVTLLLMFEELPEAARRYITVKALRVYQERVLGSQVLSQFQQQDEARSRAALMADERKHGVPNMLTGLLPPVGTWQVNQALSLVAIYVLNNSVVEITGNGANAFDTYHVRFVTDSAGTCSVGGEGNHQTRFTL